MLPLPNLDDRLFDQMVEDARKMIPKLAPQWTDENYHDPGITFVELFAWLIEMQQYYLNRITTQNQLKFLKLLGLGLNEASIARTDVTFDGIPGPSVLPRGTKLASDGRIFETEERLYLITARIERIIVLSESDAYDYTQANSYQGVTYFAFGPDARKGSRLYIGFDEALPAGKNICLTIKLFEDYPLPYGDKGGSGINLCPSASISWKYYGHEQEVREKPPGWLPLQLVKDETVYLSRSGRVTFSIPGRMSPAKIHPANDKTRFWICCTVDEEGYEISPKVEQILLNTISAAHHNTLSQVLSFSGSGRPGYYIEVNDYLPYYGLNSVQVREADGYWRYWTEVEDLEGRGPDEPCYKITRDESEKTVIVTFGDGVSGKIAPEGSGNIRLISYEQLFAGERFLGRSNGLPNQLLRIGRKVIPRSLILQVGHQIPGTNHYVWEDWTGVEDLDASGPADRHFVFNPDTGEILFGNNENGAVPKASNNDNVCVISCRTGGGEEGNIKENEINKMVIRPPELGKVTVTNLQAAGGGAERETLDEAVLRVRKELKKPYRAVTSQDYEEIVHATPGLRVARVKAIPLYSPGMKNYPQNKAPAQVTVVVVPFSESIKPLPSRGFLETVRNHLDQYRLITTEVHVIPPEYIKVTVHADIVVSPYVKVDPARVLDALNRLLQPLDKKEHTKGWPFGRTVYKGDIYEAINKIDGIEYIKDLWINAEGKGIQKELSGDIKIPPNGLVYSGDHHIEIIRRTDL